MDQSPRRTVRLAAALFFFVCIPLSLWDQFYVPQKIFVAQDPVTTASNLLSNEFIFRTAILSHFAGILAFAFMIILFARVFRSVDNHLTRLMIIPIAATIPVTFILEVINYSALMILKSDVRPTFDLVQQQEAAYLLIRIYRYGVNPGLSKLLFGLCFIPFGLVVLKSKMTPRIIGILLIIGGAGYVTDCCISVLLQRPMYLMIRSYLMYTTVAYVLALLWFLVKSVREPSMKDEVK